MNRARFLAFLFVAICGQAGAQPAPFVQYQTQPTPPWELIEVPDPVTGISLIAPSTLPRTVNGTVTIVGNADYLKAEAGVSGTGTSFFALVYAGWSDLLTFDGPGLTRQAGFVDLTLNYSWDLDVVGTPGPIANATLVFTFNTDVESGAVEFGRTITESVIGSEGVNYRLGPSLFDYRTGEPLGDVSGSSITFHIPVVFGHQYWVFQGIQTLVSGLETAGDTIAFADATHSLTWGGVAATDAFGNPVAFDIASASGVDYAVVPAPIPEPETYLLLALGLAILGLRRRNTSAALATRRFAA